MSEDTSNDVQSTGLQATYAGAKRKIAALEQQLQNLKEAGMKRKSDLISNVTQGRAISRLVSMFDTVDGLVEESDRRRRLADDTPDDDESDPSVLEHSQDQWRTFRGYQLLTQYVSSIEKKLVDMDVHDLNTYFRELRKGAGGARGDDAANLKPCVVSWIGTFFENPNPPFSPTTKSDRGFEHDMTGRLLCPIEYNWDDPSERQKVKDGHPDFSVTGDSWPALLYPHAKGDSEDAEKGLFKSALLVKVFYQLLDLAGIYYPTFKFIFTSPTSAQEIDCENDVEDQAARPPKRARSHRAPTRGHIANILGLKTVTPRSIAYIAVQLRFSLSNASAWNEDDGCFNYVTFYNNIISYFEDAPGPAARAEAQKLLSWWSRKVFGRVTSTGGPQSHVGSSVSKLALQRAARELGNRNRQ